MIEFMQESRDNVLGIRATGKLSKEDYDNRLEPKLSSMIERFGKVRALFYMDEAFRGWNLEAAWANTVLDVRHRASFEKVAIVGAPRWEEWCVSLAGIFIAGEMRTFRTHRLREAWDWVRA